METLFTSIKYRFCGECYNTYVLGVSGVEAGCDECRQVVRNSAGWVIRDLNGEYYDDTYKCGDVCCEDKIS